MELFSKSIEINSKELGDEISSVSILTLPGEKGIMLTGIRRHHALDQSRIAAQSLFLSDEAAEELHNILGEWKEKRESFRWCGVCNEKLPNHKPTCPMKD